MQDIFQEAVSQLKGPIVVFGGGGFIGSQLAKLIFKYRSDCYVVTQQEQIPQKLKNYENNVIKCNIKDATSVDEIFQKYKFKTVFNLAAYGAYSTQKDPKLIFETNVLGLINLAESALKFSVDAFVNFGSSSEYGLNAAAPSENSLLQPNSYYSVSKISGSYLVNYLGKIKKLPIVHLRLYSIYGPGEEETRLIPKLLLAAKNNNFPELVDKNISRDFVYVEDVLEASFIAALKGVQLYPGESFNVAAGKKVTIGELVDVVGDLFQITAKPEWNSMENRHWDLNDWYGNNEKIHKFLGWFPRTSLQEGLVKTFKHLNEVESIPKLIQYEDKSKNKLSAIIACYKDAQAIPFMHERLTKVFHTLGVEYEIIFINDCSPDNSSEILEEIINRDCNVIAIEHSRNFGSQAAFFSGMQIATGDAVILLDGDLQDPPELIIDFYYKWQEGYDVVYGNRIKRETTILLNICYKIFYRLFSKLSYIKIPLDAGDFSLIDKRVVCEMIKLKETDLFLRGLRAWVGFKQIGVNYIRPERMFGKSTNNWFKNIWWARKAIFSFSFAPLDMLFYGGIFTTIISFIMLIIQTVSKILNPHIPHGITTIILLVLFFSGVQMFCLSIIGEYVGKTLEETKSRPKFIRKQILTKFAKYENSVDIANFIKHRLKNKI